MVALHCNRYGIAEYLLQHELVEPNASNELGEWEVWYNHCHSRHAPWYAQRGRASHLIGDVRVHHSTNT